MFKDSWLTVIGVGPGSGEYVTPAARRAAAAAEVLIGGRKALDLFADLECEKMLITGDLERLRDFLLKIRGRPTAVLVSGDPGLFSLLPWVKRQFPGEKINVIPGISSIQLAFARLACGWEDVVFLSCHGRSLEVLEPYLPRLKSAQVRLAILTGGANTPGYRKIFSRPRPRRPDGMGRYRTGRRRRANGLADGGRAGPQ